MKNIFAAQFKEYRKKLDISQEEIAEKLNVTSQAVSKWECEKSYPDTEMLVDIATLFGISLDELILGKKDICVTDIPNDDKLRVVFCRGRHVIDSSEADSTIKIRFDTKADSIEISGNVNIAGEVYGDVNAGGSIACDTVHGNVNAGTSVNCDEVSGNVSAGAGVNCDSVVGDVSAGTNIVCDDIGGDVSCGLTIQCDNISGNVNCGMTITCDTINGDICECNGDIHVKTLNGTVNKCEKTLYIKDDKQGN